jgi:S-DNA-T family DNA segregation ATPase FtsK/SpoIIIE
MEPESSAIWTPTYRLPPLNLLGAQNRSFIAALTNHGEKTLPVLWSGSDKKMLVKDFADIRNLLITGSSETGKSSFIHQLIFSLLYLNPPGRIKFLLIDLKKTELGRYRGIANHFLAKRAGDEQEVIDDGRIAIHTLNSLCIELDNRYDLIGEGGCRDIHEYNRKFLEGKLNPEKGHQLLPFIILVIDELADCILYGKKEIDAPLQRLVYRGGKVGLFTIIATNQYNSGVISSALLSGIEQRVVFRLNDRDDYAKFFGTVRVPDIYAAGEFVYRENGAQLKGEGIYFTPAEIDRTVEYITTQPGFLHLFLLPDYVDENEPDRFDMANRDPLFEEAARLVVITQMGSTSLLQRRMKLGYNRVGRLMDQLQAAGIVGPVQGAKAREVLIRTEEELQEFLGSFDLTGTAYVPPVRETNIHSAEAQPTATTQTSVFTQAKKEKPGCLLFVLTVIGFVIFYWVIV